MKHEEIARRYSRRSGFRLVNYRQVALPVFRVFLRVLMQEQKKLSPIQEYVMRAIRNGLASPGEIAGVLGLEEKIVRTSLQMLMHSDDVIMGHGSDGRKHQLFLTGKGSKTLEMALITVPEEVNIWMDVDGLTHRMSFLGDRAIKPAKVKELDLLEIPPYPRRKPRIEDLKVDELQRALRERYPDWRERYILAILEVERVDRMFRDDSMTLVYKAIDGNEVQVGIVVDSRLSEEHEQAFRGSNQASHLKIVPDALEDFQAEIKEVVGEEILAHMTPGEDASRIRMELESAEREVFDLTRRLEETQSHSERGEMENQIDQAVSKHSKLQAAYASHSTRMVEVFEHPNYLEDALTNSRERLMIISPWIRARVVNERFIRTIKTALDRGVDIYIGYGIGDEGGRESNWDREAIKKLEGLATSNEHFHFQYFGDTHAKVLVCDNRWVITTSFNWLSFAGDPNMAFRDERGIFSSSPTVIAQLLASYLPRFAPAEKNPEA
jgi:predicted transcriptional regulator